MKFASYLGSKDRIFILDEPTNGLHIKNVRSLLKLLNQMVDEGNSIFVIEHNIEFIKSADYVVELGPEGGDAGGRLLFAGTPSEMKMSENLLRQNIYDDTRLLHFHATQSPYL